MTEPKDSENTEPESTGEEGLTADAPASAGCVIPGTTNVVPVGGDACIDGTIQVCQSDGSFRDTLEPC
ncbi:MAG: hypothetical protein ACI8QC_004092 [Planctomycetota bacterium]|jgi:hypothetical protein